MPAQPLPSDRPIALSDRDERILEFERGGWRSPGAKEAAIREAFGFSAARYYQVLNAVIDLPAALRRDPILVKRLQRVREARTRAREARAFGRVPDEPRDGAND